MVPTLRVSLKMVKNGLTNLRNQVTNEWHNKNESYDNPLGSFPEKKKKKEGGYKIMRFNTYYDFLCGHFIY